MFSFPLVHRLLFSVLAAIVPAALTIGQEAKWTVLLGPETGFEAWKGADKWQIVGGVTLAEKPRQLAAKPGKGVFVNGKGRAPNLISKKDFGDVEIHVEFLIPKGSNSGVKFMGMYEIQILDSYGKKTPLTGDDCGGIYPRAEAKPRYHHLDKGIAPRTNACRPPGEWQTLDAVFLAPRFDKNGKKTASARLLKAVLNGVLIHDDVEWKTPTGDRWKSPEKSAGPLLLQGDHGPVAFRNVRARPYVKD
jgi:hypothetical protein